MQLVREDAAVSAGRNLIKKIRTFPSRRKVRIFCFTLFLFHRLVQLLNQGVALLDRSSCIHGFLGLFYFFLRSIQCILGGGKLRIVGLALVFLGDGIVIILGTERIAECPNAGNAVSAGSANRLVRCRMSVTTGKPCSQRSPLGSPASPQAARRGQRGAIPQRDGKSL